MASAPETVVLAEVVRGGLVESRHRGYIAVVDGTGRLVFSAGDPDVMVFLRSSAKPFQAIPLVVSGAADAYGFDDAELAISCGSHGGEPKHRATVTRMLEKAGLEASALRCGTHPPYDPQERARLEREGLAPTPLHNNCSGKHAGLLAAARHQGLPLDTYTDADHPLQQQILGVVARFAGVPREEVARGLDGCDIPTWAVPLRAAARMFARLVAPPSDFGAEGEAARRLARAMMRHPEMVEGDADDCIDTALMRALPGRIVTKVGAEGVFAAGVLPCPAYPTGLGIALKIDDGDGQERARPVVSGAVLERFGLFDGAEVPACVAPAPLINHAGEEAGEVRAAFG